MIKCYYVVQAASGLPDYYRCIQDRVILISWESRAPETTLFLPDSSWTTGRNAAYDYIIEKDISFDYIIFLDDDLRFVDISPESGFFKFENFLHDQKPAIAVPLCWDYNTKRTKIPLLPKSINRQALQNLSLQQQPVDWFDACFNAFRFDVFKDSGLLPYDVRYDKSSWYTSQFLLILKANLLYRNNIVQNNRIKILNNSIIEGTGTDYPRSLENFGEAYKNFLKEHGIKTVQMTRF